MRIARAPLRIALGGGGTDIPSFAKDFGGFTVTAAINAYVYAAVCDRDAMDMQGTALERACVGASLKARCFSDVLAGTGLGGSAAAAVAMLKAVDAAQDPTAIAEKAYAAETAAFGAGVVGKHDHYIAAYGGIKNLAFSNGNVMVVDSLINAKKLNSHLALFRSPGVRSARAALQASSAEGLQRIKELGYETRKLLEAEDYQAYGKTLREHWAIKLARSPVRDHAKNLVNIALHAGAWGAKLVGAGGCGYVLVCAADIPAIRAALSAERELPFEFDADGAQLCRL